MVKGFMGKTHALLSVLLLCLCMLIPINAFQETIGLLKNDMLFFIVGITVLIGGALLPDLDNSQSSAGSTLGPVGSMCTTFMQSTSTIIWNLFHTKRDKRPSTPHRYFWHTLVASTGVFCLLTFGLKNGESTILTDIKENSVLGVIRDRPIVLFFILMSFMAVLCGSNMVVYYIIRLLKLPKVTAYILPIASLIYVFSISYTRVHILGICIGAGCIFHCIEDFFADTGVPLLWPIPIQGMMWKRCKFVTTCETGGMFNTIFDVVILAVDMALIAIIFMKG